MSATPGMSTLDMNLSKFSFASAPMQANTTWKTAWRGASPTALPNTITNVPTPVRSVSLNMSKEWGVIREQPALYQVLKTNIKVSISIKDELSAPNNQDPPVSVRLVCETLDSKEYEFKSGIELQRFQMKHNVAHYKVMINPITKLKKENIYNDKLPLYPCDRKTKPRFWLRFYWGDCKPLESSKFYLFIRRDEQRNHIKGANNRSRETVRAKIENRRNMRAAASRQRAKNTQQAPPAARYSAYSSVAQAASRNAQISSPKMSSPSPQFASPLGRGAFSLHKKGAPGQPYQRGLMNTMRDPTKNYFNAPNKFPLNNRRAAAPGVSPGTSGVAISRQDFTDMEKEIQVQMVETQQQIQKIQSMGQKQAAIEKTVVCGYNKYVEFSFLADGMQVLNNRFLLVVDELPTTTSTAMQWWQKQTLYDGDPQKIKGVIGQQLLRLRAGDAPIIAVCWLQAYNGSCGPIPTPSVPVTQAQPTTPVALRVFGDEMLHVENGQLIMQCKASNATDNVPRWYRTCVRLFSLSPTIELTQIAPLKSEWVYYGAQTAAGIARVHADFRMQAAPKSVSLATLANQHMDHLEQLKYLHNNLLRLKHQADAMHIDFIQLVDSPDKMQICTQVIKPHITVKLLRDKLKVTEGFVEVSLIWSFDSDSKIDAALSSWKTITVPNGVYYETSKAFNSDTISIKFKHIHLNNWTSIKKFVRNHLPKQKWKSRWIKANYGLKFTLKSSTGQTVCVMEVPGLFSIDIRRENDPNYVPVSKAVQTKKRRSSSLLETESIGSLGSLGSMSSFGSLGSVSSSPGGFEDKGRGNGDSMQALLAVLSEDENNASQASVSFQMPSPKISNSPKIPNSFLRSVSPPFKRARKEIESSGSTDFLAFSPRGLSPSQSISPDETEDMDVSN